MESNRLNAPVEKTVVLESVVPQAPERSLKLSLRLTPETQQMEN
jgi:hypothetical protein